MSVCLTGWNRLRPGFRLWIGVSAGVSIRIDDGNVEQSKRVNGCLCPQERVCEVRVSCCRNETTAKRTNKVNVENNNSSLSSHARTFITEGGNRLEQPDIEHASG